MEDIFLTPQLKDYYMKDFNNLLTIKEGFWAIDKPILESLIVINANQKEQTLYSKCDIGYLGSPDTYLELAFCKTIELQIFRTILPDVLYRFNSIRMNGSNCYYRYSRPTKNSNFDSKMEKLGMGCVDDEDYFWINSIAIHLKTNNGKMKKEFWEYLGIVLTGLK